MPILHRLLASIIAMVFAAGITATFIVEDSSSADDSAASDGTTSTIDTVPDKPKDGGDGSKEASSTTTSATTGETSSTTAAKASTSTTTTTTQAPATTAQPRLGVTPTTPGTYTYDITGTYTYDHNGDPEEEDVKGTSTLSVPDAGAEGRQSQVEESQFDNGESSKTTTVYRFTNEGTYLESITTGQAGQSFTLEATSPFLVISASAQQGTTSRGQLRGDGMTADVTFTIVEVGADTFTAQVDTEISGSVSRFTATCDIDGTMNSTMVARSRDQLPLDTHTLSETTVSGSSCPDSFGGQQIKGTTTSDTRSVLRQ